ncbi:pentapeptide repeat-containing protein [Arthrobacter sp. Sa2CUA1]|uniref:Pentapeptide repeat-containing protein n=1 Tax=Arthrobacter gallicola TaxID=2762225 RepID=A0ABR8UN65_9MICC|nr:pentapeptide repeat-containing protein [Arthrobacter gallicola]MBD7993995.1 pentapeptide repeat-containing protein [Arthrobacter gallicola]
MPVPQPAPGRFLSLTPLREREELRPDCSSCYALCCTAFGFARSADFAVDKAPGTPCSNLAEDFTCTIHASLRPRGFSGCTVFDCHGAGQTVSQGYYAGEDWRTHPEAAREMFSTFAVVRQLHEMLWYLAEAADRAFDPETTGSAEELRTLIGSELQQGPHALLALDLSALHARVRALLLEVSAEVRAGYFAEGQQDAGADLQPSADLMGRDLRRVFLCGADLRGTYLIGADLRGADLAGTDLLGADLRGSRLEGADLSRALYLTQAQVTAATGNSETLLPPVLRRPGHWREG